MLKPNLSYYVLVIALQIDQNNFTRFIIINYTGFLSSTQWIHFMNNDDFYFQLF